MSKIAEPKLHEKERVSFDWLALWILFSAWSSISGWCLSLLGCLNSVGMVISALLFVASFILLRSHFQIKRAQAEFRIVRSRFLVPRIWLLLTVLALIGGIAYAPNNYDYLTYRFPRVLYWSWEQTWTWVPTVNERINISGTGFEWLMVPLFIPFKTDRLFFLINSVSFLLLPGLIFSVFTNLGISKRISWWWMWVLPCGYCYILQAASAGNDSFATVYFLASLYYLFQAKISSSVKNLFLSCLAIALMTGVKASTIPLVLPWLILAFFQRGHLLEKSRPVMIGMVLIFAAAASFLPMALLNIHFTGDYAGDPNNKKKMKLSNPVSGVVVNSLQLAKDNLVPPILPHSIDWTSLLPFHLKANLLHDFPLMDLHSGELQIEEEAGVGLGVVLFAGLFSVMGVGVKFVDPSPRVARNKQALWVAGAGAVALLAYMSKMGIPSTSRLIAAYYPLLIVGILVTVSLDGRVVHRSALKWVGILAMLSALPLVILCPARPLFPVHFVSDMLAGSRGFAGFIARYNQVYSAYAARADAFKELIPLIPPSERVIGFLQTEDDPEACLWRPYGTREVLEVTPEDSLEKVKALGIHFVVISRDALNNRYQTTIAMLLSKWSGSLIAEKSIVLKAHRGPETWYLLSL